MENVKSTLSTHKEQPRIFVLRERLPNARNREEIDTHRVHCGRHRRGTERRKSPDSAVPAPPERKGGIRRGRRHPD